MSHESHAPSASSSREPAKAATPVAPVTPLAPASTDGHLTMIERLSDLRQKNILTEDEFAAKKAELLNRL